MRKSTKLFLTSNKISLKIIIVWLFCHFCLDIQGQIGNFVAVLIIIGTMRTLSMLDTNQDDKTMNPKTQRLSLIRKIIRSEFISSQEELISRLEENGVQITQSTLSRDLKFMHVAKVPHKAKGYIYVLPNSTANDMHVSTNVTDNITDIAFSGNMCVITTKPGYASAISVPIDSRGISEVLGSIAGDNTILLILREGFNMEALMEQLYILFPSIRHL